MTSQQIIAIRPVTGRLPELIPILSEAKREHEARGASRVLAVQALHAGPAAGIVGYILEAPDAQSLGKLLDANQEARQLGEGALARAFTRVHWGQPARYARARCRSHGDHPR